MSFVDRLLGFPNTILQLVQACTFHMGEVKDVWDPKGKGDVRMEIVSIGGEKSKTNWSPCCNSNAGPNEDGASPSGLWNPARIGERRFVFFPGGKTSQLASISAGVAMTDKGNAGSRRA